MLLQDSFKGLRRVNRGDTKHLLDNSIDSCDRILPSTRMKSSLLLQLLTLTAALAIEQMHLSLTGKPGEMAVEFVTAAAQPYSCFWDSSAPPAHPSTPLPPSPAVPGFLYGAGYLVAGDDLFSMSATVPAAAAWCSANATCVGFTFADADPSCGGAACRMLFKSAAYFAPSTGWQTYEKPAPPRPNATSTFFPYLNASLGPIGQMHTAVMRGLAPNVSYYYACGSGDDWSPVQQFVSGPRRAGGDTYAIFADFGRDNDESLVALYAAAESRDMDYIIHAGDFAYDFDSENGNVGNEFMRSMSGYASSIPVMCSPGNHGAGLHARPPRASLDAPKLHPLTQTPPPRRVP